MTGEIEEYASIGAIIPGYCQDHGVTEVIRADSSGQRTHTDHHEEVWNRGGGRYVRSGTLGTITQSGVHEVVTYEHDFDSLGTILSQRIDGMAIDRCFAIRPGLFGIGVPAPTDWDACGVDLDPGARAVSVLRMWPSRHVAAFFGSPSHAEEIAGLERVTQWFAATPGWRVTVDDSDGASVEVTFDQFLRPTAFEAHDATAEARAEALFSYAVTSTARSVTTTLSSTDAGQSPQSTTRTRSVDAGVTPRAVVNTTLRPNGERTRTTTVADLSGDVAIEHLDDDGAPVSVTEIDVDRPNRTASLVPNSQTTHTFVQSEDALTMTWQLPPSDACDTDDDCVPDDCGLLCGATAICVAGQCANGAISTSASSTVDFDGAVRARTLPGGIAIDYAYSHGVCLPTGGTCTSDEDCDEDDTCELSNAESPRQISVSGDGTRALEKWKATRDVSADGALLETLSSAQGITVSVEQTATSPGTVISSWSDSAGTLIGNASTETAQHGALISRTVSAAQSATVYVRFDRSRLERGEQFGISAMGSLTPIAGFVSTPSLAEDVPSTTALELHANHGGGGLYTATLTDDFGRPTRRAWALEPLPTTLPTCATFMANDEGSGIYCEELGHDTLNRIVADVTRINESADGGSAEVDAWAYAYTPGDGRLESATLNGTEGAEYAWSANGTLEALNRNITGLAPRAVGGTDVIVDPQDRLWRFGDIRYGYTPDGRTTWRRERSSNGTERLLCLDYDVFSGLRGVQWITEGSSEELGCDAVEEFDGEVDYLLDANGRRIVPERTVQSYKPALPRPSTACRA